MAKFVTKKFVLIMLAVVIAAGGVIWAIVANIKPAFKPMITDVPAAYTVSGNGSASVMVDNYLYFVGDYLATSEIKYGDNDYYPNATMPAAGIYRVKIENSQPVLTYEYDNYYYDDDGVRHEYVNGDTGYNKKVVAVQDWENLGNKNYHVESVVPKIAGHDNTAMWVFGNTLVYTTPNNLRNKVGELRSGYLDFYRVDLDGKNHKLVYSATVKDLTADNFTVWANNTTDNIYLLINEGGTLRKINVNTQKVTTIAEDVTAAVLPQVTQYRRNANNEKLADLYGGVMAYVYYTTNRDSESTSQGNLLYRYQIAGNNDPELIGDEGSNYEASYTFTPVAAVGGHFVFTAKSSAGNALTQYCVVTNGMSVNTQSEYEALINQGSTFGDGSDITFYGGSFWLQDGKLRRYDVNPNNGKVTPNETVYGTEITKVLAFIDNKIYVQTSSAIKILDAAHPGESLGTAISLTTDDGGDAPTMPVAILRPAHNTGDIAGTDLVFIHTADDIKTYAQNGLTPAYLRLKNN